MPRKYTFTFDKNGPPIDEHFLDFIDGMFSQLNIDPGTAQHMARMYQGYIGQRVAAATADGQRALDGLKAKWGNRFDEHVAAGQRAARALGLDGKTLQAIESSLGTPHMATLLTAIGNRLGGAAPASGQPQGNPQPAASDGTMTPEAARAEISRLGRDKAWQDSLFDKRHSQHVENTQRWTDLHAQAYPAPEPVAAPAAPAPSNGNDAASAAKAKIEGWIGNQGFMSSLADKQHTDHKVNTEAWDAAHREAGLK